MRTKGPSHQECTFDLRFIGSRTTRLPGIMGVLQKRGVVSVLGEFLPRIAIAPCALSAIIVEILNSRALVIFSDVALF